jgi:hypothetical protein
MSGSFVLVVVLVLVLDLSVVSRTRTIRENVRSISLPFPSDKTWMPSGTA